VAREHIPFAAPLSWRYMRRGVDLRALVIALSLLVLSGCTTASYLAQAGCGQIDLMLRARDLDATIADPKVPARTRGLLSQVATIKKFGEKHSLKPTGNYHRFVQLDRSVVVWVVTASDPLRFRSKTWSFPIAGRVPYLGFFDRDAAHSFAASLREEGLDVDVGGAEAYSTLGWFDDPVLSTMLGGGDEAIGGLAEVVLHESVHATLYLDGQTRFNESLAEFVSNRLTLTYLDERYGESSAEKRAFVDGERRAKERREKMHRAYEKLEALYASNRPRDEKLLEKRRVLAALRRETRRRRPINNATLASFKNYHSGTRDLDALLAACGGSYQRFFATLTPLKKNRSVFAGPNQQDLAPVLKPLIQAGCPAPT
jgi:predicted aminopeptidase